MVEDLSRVATFIRGDLDECVTVLRTITLPPGEAWRPAPIEFLPNASRETVVLAQPCDEAFAGRTIMATCTRREARPPREGEPAALVGEVLSESRMYRFETALETDARMHECLTSGGAWEGLREDSDEFRRARVEALAARYR